MISMPYPFPEVEGITCHYLSFLFLIYRRLIKLESECGESVLKKNETINLHDPNWDLIARVKKAYGGACLMSGKEQDNFYSFYLNLDIIGGNLKENLDKADKNYKIELMQNITLPISIGELKIFGKSNTDNPLLCKAIVLTDSKTGESAFYNSIKDAAKFLGGDSMKGAISSCCRGKRKRVRGYYCKYLEQ
jgi:hypothetical protein